MPKARAGAWRIRAGCWCGLIVYLGVPLGLGWAGAAEIQGLGGPRCERTHNFHLSRSPGFRVYRVTSRM